MKAVVLICLLAGVCAGCMTHHRTPGYFEADVPLSLCFVPEMAYIPEVDGWIYYGSVSHPKLDADPTEIHTAMSDWKKREKWVEKYISPEVVRSLSGWAQSQMKGYKSVPPLCNTKFTPVALHETHRKILFEGTVDTLPSHSVVVTRWLKIFLIYDVDSHTVIRATITIRGQKLE